MKNSMKHLMQEVQTMVIAMTEPKFLTEIDTIGKLLINACQNRHTVFITGNGGSWADADHFAGELRAQFEVKGRQALPSIAIPVSLSTLTAWGNDYDQGFETAAVRDLEALAKPGDILIAISTSGKAKNVRKALEWGKEHQLTSLAISGNGPLTQGFGALADHRIIIPHHATARVQEGYQIVIHMLCSYIDTIEK